MLLDAQVTVAFMLLRPQSLAAALGEALRQFSGRDSRAGDLGALHAWYEDEYEPAAAGTAAAAGSAGPSNASRGAAAAAADSEGGESDGSGEQDADAAGPSTSGPRCAVAI